MQLGDPDWLAAVARAINASDAYRRAASRWRWPLGLGFLDPHAPRYAVLDLQDGHCRQARTVDRRAFDHAPFRLSADVGTWHRVLEGRTEPMRCILLEDLQLEGERLTALRFLPAAKALVEAMATVDRGATVP